MTPWIILSHDVFLFTKKFIKIQYFVLENFFHCKTLTLSRYFVSNVESSFRLIIADWLL